MAFFKHCRNLNMYFNGVYDVIFNYKSFEYSIGYCDLFPLWFEFVYIFISCICEFHVIDWTTISEIQIKIYRIFVKQKTLKLTQISIYPRKAKTRQWSVWSYNGNKKKIKINSTFLILSKNIRESIKHRYIRCWFLNS